MRFLVAGGGGFIGSHLVDLLVARGEAVVVMDDFSTGRRSNLDHLVDFHEVHVVVHDITEPLPDVGSVDGVFHLASPASPADFGVRALQILETGSLGTRRLLDLAASAGVPFLLASSSEVYGDPLDHPQRENHAGNVDPVGPRSCYDEAKRFAEALTTAHSRSCGTATSIARIFNTYGERMDPSDGRVVNTFIGQALRGEPLTVYGDGSQTRSFCHVSDLVGGLVDLLASQHQSPVNLGNPQEVSIADLARLVVSVADSTSEVRFIDLPDGRSGDPTRRRPDVSLAEAVIGWEPVVDLAEGLTRMVEHFRSRESLD